MKLSIQIQRSVIQKIASSPTLSNRHIADIYKISPTTVAKLRLKFQQSHKSWEQLAPLSDHDFKIQLGTYHHYRKEKPLVHPDYELVHKEMQKRDITLKLLHFEYLDEMKDAPEQIISYSTFAHTYNIWLKKQKISMRQIHRAGEKMFVDFCGKTIAITDPKTGDVSKAQIFVAVLGASRYTFVYAVPSQKQNDWLTCHIEAFNFFGGVPQQIIPDNLKSAVIHNKKDSILLSQSYSNLAEHYQCVIVPARSRKPKDKSLAEIMVQIVQRWILAALRHHQFFSIDDLNKALSKRLEVLNNKKTQTFIESRLDNFLKNEQHALIPLPDIPYQIGQWKYNIRVPNDYHVEYDKHFYSVPYHYMGQLVNIRANQNSIEILVGNSRIATHIRKFEYGVSTHSEHQTLNHYMQSQNEEDALFTWSKQLGPFGQEWVSKNLQQRKDFANGLKAVRSLKRELQQEQFYDQVELACEYQLRFNQLGFKSLLDAIKYKKYLPPSTIEINIKTTKHHENLRGADYYKNEDEDEDEDEDKEKE